MAKVRLLKSIEGYSVGEIIKVSTSVARRYVWQGVATMNLDPVPGPRRHRTPVNRQAIAPLIKSGIGRGRRV